MKNEDNIKDWRSTGRRKARKELYESYTAYKCVGYTDSGGIHHKCGKTSKEPPKDAPTWFEEIWPEEDRVLDYSLQADHESKDFTNNDVAYLNWRCVPCHKRADLQTSVGESRVAKDFF